MVFSSAKKYSTANDISNIFVLNGRRIMLSTTANALRESLSLHLGKEYRIFNVEKCQFALVRLKWMSLRAQTSIEQRMTNRFPDYCSLENKAPSKQFHDSIIVKVVQGH